MSCRRTGELPEASPEQRPMAVQLFGDDPEILAEAARRAMAYAPEISPVSALNRLAEWMRYNDRLTRELGDTGYRPRQRVFTSLQVELIFRYLGRP